MYPSHARRYEGAETQLLAAYEVERQMRGEHHWHVRECVDAIAGLHSAWDKPDQAAEWRAKLPTEHDAVASDPPADEKQEE